MIHLILHFFIIIIQRFFLGIGGITRWIFFQLYNECFTEKYPADLDYYVDNENDKKDKNGLTVGNKNFFSGLIVFVIIIELLN